MNKRYQLPEHRKSPVPAFLWDEAKRWEPCTDGLLTSLRLRCGLRVRRIRYEFPTLAGKSVLFLSDLHIRARSVMSICPTLRISPGIDWIRTALRELFDAIPCPDMILFGGDLAAEAALLGPAADCLADILPGGNMPRFAVAGNWEMRRIWMKPDDWTNVMKRAGFDLLKPGRSASATGFEVQTLADYKEEKQTPPSPYAVQDAFHCVLMHNPDAVTAINNPDFLRQTHFMFAGHTHGGQLRLPFYGAMITSSRFGKKFEYGLYRHKVHGTMMFVSAGIGTTWIPARFLCPPEVVVLTFI